MFSNFRHIGRGNFYQAFKIAPRHTDQAGIIRIIGQAVCIGLQIIEQFAKLFVDTALGGKTRQKRQVSCAMTRLISQSMKVVANMSGIKRGSAQP